MSPPTNNRAPADYRPNVGVVIFNDIGQVWVGKRMGQDGPYSWQFPQGGIDDGEAPERAALREMFEETGIREDQITPLGEIAEWLYYDFPPGLKARKRLNFKGQRQRWYAVRFHGRAGDINLTAHGEQEFSHWRWAELADTPDMIVPMKRDVYVRLAVEFAGFSRLAL